MVDLILVLATIFFVIIAIYQADKNKNNKSISYKLSKTVANILNFVTFLDIRDVNNIIDDIEDKNNKDKD